MVGLGKALETLSAPSTFWPTEAFFSVKVSFCELHDILLVADQVIGLLLWIKKWN
jgi:hypothetical protein